MLEKLIFQHEFQDCSQRDLGGKAYHLLKIKDEGLNVPPFFIIPSKMIAQIIKPIQHKIEALSSRIKTINDPHLFSISKEIQKEILDLDFSKGFQKEIHETCIALFGDEYFVAVRSSAAAEDGKKASFAGQHDTFLFVPANHLISKIRKCIASAWSHSVLSYRLAQNISIQNIEFAIVIQQMIKAKKSGISFSMNQNGNLADLIMVVGYGLGEGVVTNQVETDTFIINRQHQTIDEKLVTKHLQINFQDEKGINKVPVRSALKNIPTLNETEIMQVFHLTMTAEKLLAAPADIEFSFDKNGDLFLLQMRPITTINLDEIEILDNTNIVESYPGITFPLSFSFALEAYEKVFKGSSNAFWVSDKVIEKNTIIFQNLLAQYYGRIYYRLDNWYKMMSLVHSSASSMEAWEKAVGLKKSERDNVKFNFQNKIKALLSIIWLMINYRRGNKRFFKIFAENYIFLKNIKPHINDPKALWAHYETATTRLFKPWYLTIVNDFLAFKFFGWLQDLIAKYNLSKSESLANDLLCGIGGVESEEAILNVLKLKESILADTELESLFQKEEHKILEKLEHGAYPDFYQEIKYHLERYGDRTLAELKLETPSLRNEPLFFIQLLKNQLSTKVKRKDFAQRQKEIRNNAEAIINANLKWWNPKTYIFKFVRYMAAYGLKNRENMRFCRTRGYGAVKDVFLEIGKMMKVTGVIKNVNDIFYLTTNDLKSFCKYNVIDSKMDQIEHLKKQYHSFKTLQLPDRVIYQKDDLPIVKNEKTLKNTLAKFNQGIAVSKGIVTAEAAIILQPEPHINVHGKILVSEMTDPGWVFLMMQAVGLVSEKGSLLSHTAIVGRELGIPVVVGLSGATSIFKDGDILKMDGSLGIVELVNT